MIRDILSLENAVFRFESIVIYRSLQQDDIIKGFVTIARLLAKGETRNKALAEPSCGWLSTLITEAEAKGFAGNIFRKHVVDLFLRDDNAFTLACENKQVLNHKSLLKFVLADMNALKFFMDFDIGNMCESIGFDKEIAHYRPVCPQDYPLIEQIEAMERADQILELLIRYHQNTGAGQFAAHRMLTVHVGKEQTPSVSIVGIKHADPVTFADIVGYETQKAALINNTEAFLTGAPANNVLLVGPSGTGKSSCVKALANTYYGRSLRLISINASEIHMIKNCLNDLARRGKYFIIFIDDLSFEFLDENYLCMKSMLEGGAEVCPPNVLFYATSNRRHLVREEWGDRVDNMESGDVHITDTVTEKLSLSDRFGITLVFPKPTPDEYQNILLDIAKKENLDMCENFLREQSMKWELNHNGLSGRSARQFIKNVIGEIKKI